MAVNDDYILELLVNAGMISQTDAASAKAQATQRGVAVTDVLIQNGLVSSEDILQEMANETGTEFLPVIDHVEQDAIDLLQKEQVRRYHILPLSRHGNVVRVAISDPLDFGTLDSLRHILKLDVEPVIVPQPEINKTIARFYGELDESVDSLMNSYGDLGLDVKDPNSETLDAGKEAEGDAPIIKMVYGIIMDAYRLKASDIHLEPLEKRFRLRYRMDGVLQEMRDPPKRLQSTILSRIKIMANISIAEKRLPQDGRISIALQDGGSVDLRVSTVPTVHGESIVMRILDKTGLQLGLPQLGFFADDQATMERILGLPDGIFLVTGPTGSGKSTTLYACLNSLNKPDRKLITVEDPVEYEVPGMNQVQVNEDAGMTFAAALRSMLRQAPNIIMVGEIRDAETANIAINASLTGHLVFSTLHTNDAPTAVTRLIDIGVKPFLVSSSIRAVMAQRLIRKVCAKCAQPYTPSDIELRALNLNSTQIAEASFKHGHGCDTCRGSGYKGRSGIFEIFVVDDELRTLINDQAGISAIRQRARDLGMRTLREDGIRKVVAGVTTPEEVISATTGDKD
ncbi:MAG: Flp pilus assembly complex ATPase component TadA [Verrucomicrobiales bacterium]|jgi:general secretion pathway protein E/type IV pilus assembly protein PilB|nr:Flp pilus assembly complex ATPase component TadA [Verrucomicrobiales bacterium]